MICFLYRSHAGVAQTPRPPRKSEMKPSCETELLYPDSQSRSFLSRLQEDDYWAGVEKLNARYAARNKSFDPKVQESRNIEPITEGSKGLKREKMEGGRGGEEWFEKDEITIYLSLKTHRSRFLPLFSVLLLMIHLFIIIQVHRVYSIPLPWKPPIEKIYLHTHRPCEQKPGL